MQKMYFEKYPRNSKKLPKNKNSIFKFIDVWNECCVWKLKCFGTFKNKNPICI